MSAFSSNENTAAAQRKAKIKENILAMALTPAIVTAGKNNTAGYLEIYGIDDPVEAEVNTAITELAGAGAIDES